MDKINVTQLLLATIPAIITGIVTVVVSLSNHHKINEIHVLVNGRLSELLNLTKASAEAKGRLEMQKELETK